MSIDPSRPITTWSAAARLLGMCDDTLKKKRVKYGDRTQEPWWENEKALKAWWLALIAPKAEPEQPRKRRPRARPDLRTKAADIDAVFAELLKAG